MMRSAALLLALAAANPAPAASLVVDVDGIASAEGSVGCALYTGPEGFLDSARAAALVAVPADPAGVTCRFDGLADGIYAVAVHHDVNGNGEVDTNLIGIPQEPWGVTNNARPRMSAPSFEDAALRVEGDGAAAARVTVAE
ncbi:DUF2141 domain-containing protein [Mongoliimonas terrestris]|uniref:DUF2141 domain-containing protein n=1 Tax=Mongoliimonas terrestris TaxID=1709001 RepID=UPI00094971A1|nr:DUF2141 domain-containing protein [Mongoliimonas terrestris]